MYKQIPMEQEIRVSDRFPHEQYTVKQSSFSLYTQADGDNY